MYRILKKEKGQSLVEFALILPIIILIVMIPIDFFRYMNTKILLSSAASECICNVNYDEISKGTVQSTITSILQKNYSDRLDTDEVNINFAYNGSTKKENYTFYVYSSDKANTDAKRFWEQFQSRASNYTKAPIELNLSYNMSPITFWGSFFFGKTIKINTKTFDREVYVNGYEP